MPALNNGSYRRVFIDKAPAQQDLVDAFTEETTFLAMSPVKPTSDSMVHKWRKLVEVDGAKAITMNGSMPQVGSTKSLESTDVGLMGGYLQVGEVELAEMKKTAGEWFDEETGPVLQVAGNDLEYSVIYNTIYPFAEENGKVIDAGGSTADSMYSLFVITFDPRDCTGLYNPNAFGNGMAFDIKPVSGGALIGLNENAAGEKVFGYQQRMMSNYGFMIGNERRISVIRNIDLTAADTDTGYTALPTEAMMRQAIRDARAKGKNSYIVSHPAVFDAMQTYFAQALRTAVTDDAYSTEYLSWNSIPWLTTYNMEDGTEAVYS